MKLYLYTIMESESVYFRALLAENIELKRKIGDISCNANIDAIKFENLILNERVKELESRICLLESHNLKLIQDNFTLYNKTYLFDVNIYNMQMHNIKINNDCHNLKCDISILKNEITQLKSDEFMKKYRNNLLMSIQDLNIAKQLEKNVIYPYNLLFRLNRSKRVTNSHFIIEDDDENTLNHKYYALLQYLKSLPANIKKTFDKYIDKTEKFSIIDEVIKILSEQEYNNIDTELLDDCLNWFLC